MRNTVGFGSLTAATISLNRAPSLAVRCSISRIWKALRNTFTGSWLGSLFIANIMTQHAEKYQAKTIIGLPIAMFAPATQPLVRFLVLGLSPTDPLTFLSVVALLAAVAIAATIGPA